MGSDDTAQRQPERIAGPTLRLLTLNLGLLGFGLKSRWRMPVDSCLGERLAAAPPLLSSVEADIIALQEIYSSTDRQFLTHAIAARYPFHAGSPKTRSLVGKGLMLLSRFPILHSSFTPCQGAPLWTLPFWKQGLLAVELELPLIGRTRLINAHIAASVPFGHSGSRASEANRRREIAQLLSASAGGEAAILVGDFNTSPEIHPEHYKSIIDAGYLDAFAASNPSIQVSAGVTWDSANPLNTHGRFRGAPSQRIDHIFVANRQSSALTPASARIVLRDRIIQTAAGQLIPLSDHYGMLVTLVLARRPQH